MQLSTYAKECYTIVTVKGRLDSMTADNLQASLTTLYNEGAIFLIIDCRELEFLSSAGMRAILICHREIEKLSGRLIFTGFSAQVLEVLDLSGIGKYIESCQELEEAERIIFRIQQK